MPLFGNGMGDGNVKADNINIAVSAVGGAGAAYALTGGDLKQTIVLGGAAFITRAVADNFYNDYYYLKHLGAQYGTMDSVVRCLVAAGSTTAVSFCVQLLMDGSADLMLPVAIGAAVGSVAYAELAITGRNH
jgi:hypothetical protein